MELLAALSRAIPFAFASGINVYATVAVLGLCARYGWIELPASFEPLGHPAIVGGAVAMYLVEFVADKVPWLDTLWDAVHTVIRPAGGALLAVTAFGEPSPVMETLAALLGGSIALASHATKAGARAAANVSPEPFSNWFLSLFEDVFVLGLSSLALLYPLIALAVVLALLAVILAMASVIVRALRRRFASAPSS